MEMVDPKTKKRLEGVTDLAKTMVQRNPVANSLLTAKEVGDSAYKIRYGKDPRYAKLLKRYTSTPRRKTHSTSKSAQWERLLKKRERILLQEDPLKRAYRAAMASRDNETARIIKRVMA